MKKIAFIIPMLQPYRVTFYSKIVQSNPDLDFLFLHGLTKDTARPSYEGEVPFKTESFEPLKKQIGPYGVYFNKGLMKKVRGYRPDVIILFGNPGVITNRLLVSWAKVEGIKVCMWVCSWDAQNAKGVFKNIKDYFTKTYFKKADKFIAYSSHAQNFIQSLIGEKDNISIAYNGLDITEPLKNRSIISSQARVLRETLPKGSFLFLFVGGLLPTKKPLLLIEAFIKLQAQYPNIYLWIIGDGPQKASVHKIAEGNEKIRYWGRISESDKFFKAADCFVLPGSGGLALNQAMFWETPCISSFADGTEEDLVLEGMTGSRFRINDVNDLKEKMESMILTEERTIKEIGNRAHSLIVNQSNTNVMSSTFNNVLKELTENPF